MRLAASEDWCAKELGITAMKEEDVSMMTMITVGRPEGKTLN